MSLNKNQKLIMIAKHLCRELRRNSTNAEKIFWESVRDKRFMNKKFYRQYPVFFDFCGKEQFFILDFFCFTEDLAVEIDGGYHKRQKNYDVLRTHIISNLGISIIRFNNKEVENNLKKVLEKLRLKINSSKNNGTTKKELNRK